MRIRTKSEMKRVLSWILNNRVTELKIGNSMVTYEQGPSRCELTIDHKIYEDEAIDLLWIAKSQFYLSVPSEWIDLGLEGARK